MPAALSRITIFPIKSLDGVSLDEVEVLPSGALANDRRFALFDADGRIVNGKRTAAVHRIHAEFDLPQMTVRLADFVHGTSAEFSLHHEADALSHWLSSALGIACGLAENATVGFPDDTDAPGPTVISTATLELVATWFPGLTLDEARLRFRTNLEIDGVEPFWEDRLVGRGDAEVPFQIGNRCWLGAKACQRCVVPSRAAHGGELTPVFQKTFASRRQQTLPAWSPTDRFDHFYRLAVNTRPAPGQAQSHLRVGDRIVLA